MKQKYTLNYIKQFIKKCDNYRVLLYMKKCKRRILCASDYGRNAFLYVIFLIYFCTSCVHGILGPRRLPVCDGQNVRCSCAGDIKNVTIDSGNHGTMEIEIADCEFVHFRRNSIRNLTSLNTVRLTNIGTVLFDESALYAKGYIIDNPFFDQYNAISIPGIRIIINNTTIPEIISQTFAGFTREIIIQNTRIHRIQPFAFSNLRNVEKIEFIDCAIDYFAKQAVKNFQVDIFNLLNTKINNDLPSLSLAHVKIIRSFRIDNCNFASIDSLAFDVTEPERVEITNSKFKTVRGDAFRIVARGSIIVRNNIFEQLETGAFASLSATLDTISALGPQDFVFDNNTITNMEPRALRYNSTTLSTHIKNNKIRQPCTCEMHEKLKTISNNGFNCLTNNENFVNLEIASSTLCYKESNSFTTLIVIIVSTLVVLLVSGGVLIWLCKRHRDSKQKKWINKEISKEPGNLNMVMPEGRTYRETEVHIIVERAELLTTDL